MQCGLLLCWAKLGLIIPPQKKGHHWFWELITTTIEEQTRPVKPIIYLFMLVASNNQGDWTNEPMCGSERERPKTGILLPKFFKPNVRNNCFSDWEKLLKFEANILRSLEQFIRISM